jgi:hypothetical protein
MHSTMQDTEEMLDDMLSEEALAGKLEDEPAPRRRVVGALPQTGPSTGTTDKTADPAAEGPTEQEAQATAPAVRTPTATSSGKYKPPVRRSLPSSTTKPDVAVPPRERAATPTSRPVSLRVGGVMVDVPSEDLAKLVPPGPGEQVTPEIEITPREYTKEEQAQILSQITTQRHDDLMAEIDSMYGLTTTRLASHQEHSGTALKLLHEARSILVERPYAFADAELRMQAAKTLVNRTEDSREASKRHWPWLLAYELLWAVVLLAGLVFEGALGAWIGRLSFAGASTMTDIFPVWGTMMVGGIGGVACALWSLWYHISDKQDYDPQHNLWYMIQPFQGLVLGIIVYLVIAAGFLAFQTDIASSNVGTAAKYFPWLVAGIAGIRQTFFYELLDRIMTVLVPGSEKSS